MGAYLPAYGKDARGLSHHRETAMCRRRNVRNAAEDSPLKPGDRVLFGRYAGTDIVLNGEPYLILREEEVLGLLAKPA